MRPNLPYKECTGCAACYNICPQDAIEMELDENGFYKTKIEQKKCVECNLCVKTCPVISPCYNNNNQEPETYAYMAADNIREKSSSGGVFYNLAKTVLNRNGVVCGVAHKDDFTTQHVLVEDEEGLKKIRGSKYVMSDVGGIYREIRKKLDEGKSVLFSGCPCQVAGLNAYLGERAMDENLLTVDLICHGIPSVKAFKKYIADMHANREINYIGYKEKAYGWHASMTIDFANGERYNSPCEKDVYFWSYLSGVNKNESCGTCKFAKLPRQGDITIGDFWGISKYKKELNDGKGTSVVLINNSKGQKYFNEIENQAKLVERTPLDAAIPENANLVQSPKNHVSRNQFFKNLSSRRFGELAKWSFSTERYDVGLVGIPTYVNFGGALTYYALYCLLEDYGFRTVMISRPRSCGRPPIMPEMVYEHNPYPPNTLRLTLKDKEEMRSMNHICESFLVGSDQLFNADLYYKFGEMITLDWVSDNHRKVAYAASFGHSIFWGREELRAKMAHDMQKFDAFSVREEDAIKLAKNTFGIDAEWVLDPVFLCDKSHYIEISENAARKCTEPHIFAYILDPDETKNSIVKLCSDEKGLEVELFSEMLFKPTDKKLKSEQERFIFELRQARIEERLYSLLHSDLVVADSFHGICFAIIFEIPFIAILNKNRGATRFYTILKKLNLLNRLVSSEEEAKAIINQNVNFTMCREILRGEKERCTKWLLNSLRTDGKSQKAYSCDDIVNQKIDIQNKKHRLSEMKMNAVMNGRLFLAVSDIYQYLKMVAQYREELIVAIAVRDTPGFELNAEINSCLSGIGCKISLENKHWQSYIFIMDGGKVLKETISANQERVAYIGNIQEKSYKIVSRSYNRGDIAAIQIDGVEYAENKRGLNIVLIDKNLNAVIDSVAFDTHEKGAPCYRNNQSCKTSLPKSKVQKDGEVEIADKTSKTNAAPAQTENQKIIPAGISKTNEVLLHNAMVISTAGGCVLDYYEDKGISEIAVYGTDLLAAFIWEQAYYKNIKVVKLLSDKERELDVRFPRPGKIHMEDIHKSEVSSLSVPIVVAEIGYPEMLLNLKKRGDNVQKFGDITIYSHMKRILLEPALKYQKEYPDLKLAFFYMPAIYEMENLSEQERRLKISVEKEAENAKKTVFEDLGYDKEYIQEVTERISVLKRGSADFIKDQTRKYVNVVNGYRVTTDVPTDFRNTIYLFGNSICYGLGTHDEYTIGSVLQRELNQFYNEQSPYAVLNCSNGAGLNCKQQIDSLKYHMPQNGDVAVFVMNGFTNLLKETYADRVIWCDGKEVLSRPHDMGEIYFDLNHVNFKGYEACGKLLARRLLEGLDGSRKTVTEPPVKNDTASTEQLLNEEQEAELEKYLESIDRFRVKKESGRAGSIVMNCNPFTLGHRYLIEAASKKCDTLYIFVVEEDKSVFPFKDRIELVRKGTQDIPNVVVIPSGKFIISQLTFNAYFIKDENENIQFDPTNDVSLFAARIAPYMGITKRFAGDEPLDKVTNQYNSTMKRVLPKFGIDFEIIKRKEEGGEVISASRVRKLLQEKKFDEIQRIVPETTYSYLYERYRDSKKVLVLGGTRFMGIRLVEKMIEKNWFITIATRGVHKDSFGKSVTRVRLDRKDEQSIADALEGKEFDYVFDNTAYQGNDVNRLLPHVKCHNYIQVSSVAVYGKHHKELKESEMNTYTEPYKLTDDEKNYGLAKRDAECVALQKFSHIPSAIARIPFVVEPDNLDNKELNMRLFFYVNHIMNHRAMNITNSEYFCTFVRTGEEAEFLIYLAEHELTGIYNFSSKGSITVKEIIEYIEKKSGIKAIYSEEGDIHPFRAEHFGYSGYSYDLSNAISSGYDISELSDWIYKLLDSYIEMLR